ncbi:unnamed protein product [Allacma fusca]|uniref:Calpain catalytic domain-containing protein n=1 Tax=Allacma fusca TaxID=39272 RepID=A0A8J2PTJ9_9HEXA|nr:unnamed protein product [Allacma fusca]
MASDVVSGLLRDAGQLALRAIQVDQKEENYKVALYFYFEAINILERAHFILEDQIRNRDGIYSDEVIASNRKKLDVIENKIEEYRARTNVLEKAILAKELNEGSNSTPKKSEQEMQAERAYFLVDQALQKDVLGQNQEAIDLYTQAVELCLTAKSKSVIDEKQAAKIFAIAKQALDRAEVLKGITQNQEVAQNLTEYFEDAPEQNSHSRASISESPPPHYPIVARKTGATGAEYGLNQDMKPFVASGGDGGGGPPGKDLGEKFAYPLPFTDGGGRLHLSPKQRKNFKEWIHPSDLYDTPKMIEVVSCYSIKQTVISDCSFVASLAVSALYEKRFNKKLITGIIYPQNKNGEPVYNPCGKYMVKLHLNGVKRKVIIDDLLPVGHHNELLCSYSSNRGELWVSLLEKAYMKVMGGYDFPGSNSNIDLHALTGWIPERISMHPQDPSITFEKDKVFRMLCEHMAKGNVLVTVATGEMNEREADRAGLVTCHAYAVLDAQVVKGVKLLKLKNPWSHLRWKGNYSELDIVHWTDELKALLNYDPNCASMFDNGVFWIDYDSLCKYFEVLYLSWNPKLFANTCVVHKTWAAGVGPVKDVYSIGDNPQYMLEVQAKGEAVVWVLLTRHITEIQDFKENREYITILVYDTNGKKIYFPYDPPPLIDGVRINSPHYLCRIKVDSPGTKRYTLVVSQYSKMNTIHYTLRTYSNVKTILKEITNPYTISKKITGEWKGKTAGGCPNHPQTYPNNPCYQLSLKTTSNENQIRIELRARKDFQVGFDIVCSNVGDQKAPGFFNKKSTGSYRPGFTVLELEHVPSGVYNIIPSTYLPNLEGPFFLDIHTTCEFGINF